ncbi:hypothetical protein NBRC116495_20650 [Aurantivibrio plasticivorans]
MHAMMWGSELLAMSISHQKSGSHVRAALVVFLLSQLVVSADRIYAEDTSTQEQVTERETTDENTENSSKSKDVRNKESIDKLEDDIFIPSEEISEDLSVSFPVDI